MKRSRISDDDDVNLDDLESGLRGANGTDTGSDDDTDDQDELPDGDEDPDDADAEVDADADADEGDDTDDGDDQDDVAATGADDGTRGEPRGGRANNTIRALRAQARAAREEARALKQRFDDFVARGGQQQRQQPAQENEEQRRARRALLSSEERTEEDIRELRQLVTTTHHQTQLTTADATDRASYEARAAADPLYRRWSGKVEAERARLAGLGQFVAREAVLMFMLGKAALEARGSNAGKSQKAQAGRRVARQTVKPGDSRSDAIQSRRGGQSSLEKRLEDVPL